MVTYLGRESYNDFTVYWNNCDLFSVAAEPVSIQWVPISPHSANLVFLFKIVTGGCGVLSHDGFGLHLPMALSMPYACWPSAYLFKTFALFLSRLPSLTVTSLLCVLSIRSLLEYSLGFSTF